MLRLIALGSVSWALVATIALAVGFAPLLGGCPQNNLPDDNANLNSPANENAANDNGAGPGSNGNANTNGANGNTTNANGSANSNSANSNAANSNSGGTNANTNSSANSNSPSGVGSNGNSNGAGNGNGGNANSNGSGNGNTNSAPPPPTSFTSTALARTGDPVPGQPAGVTFTEFGDPVLDAAGRVAFWALYTGPGQLGNGGLYCFNGESLVRVVDDNPATAGSVPNRAGQDYFGRFVRNPSFEPLTQALAWGGGNRLLFKTEVDGQSRSRGIYRWRATDANIVRVVDREQVAALFPNTQAQLFSGRFFSPGVGDEGLGAFTIDYLYITSDGSQFPTGNGALTSNGTSLTVLADRQLSAAGSVPDQPASARYERINPNATISPAGEVLFQAEYNNGNGSQGVYLRSGASTVRVIDSRPNTQWTGLPLGGWVNPPDSLDAADSSPPFVAIAIGPLGDVAVETALQVGVSAPRECVLLLRRSNATWRELQGIDGAPATSLLTGVNDDTAVVVLSEGHPFLMTPTTMTRLDTTLPAGLFGVTIRWLANIGSLNNAGRAALRFERSPDQTVRPPGIAFWNGSGLLIVADAAANVPLPGIVEIGTLVGPEQDRPGRSGWANDRDEIAYRVVTGDNRETIFIARGNP